MKMNMIYSKLIYLMNQNQGGRNMVMAFMTGVGFLSYYPSMVGATNMEFDDMKPRLILECKSMCFDITFQFIYLYCCFTSPSTALDMLERCLNFIGLSHDQQT